MLKRTRAPEDLEDTRGSTSGLAATEGDLKEYVTCVREAYKVMKARRRAELAGR